jgi:hypothetical protein
VFAANTTTAFAPLDWIVKAADDKLLIVHDCPNTNVDVTGSVTVCAADPVKYCCCVLATVKTTGVADVTVEL